MGIFSALGIAVSGLRSQAFALELISGNISNAQTPGFKRTDVSFQDLVSSSDPRRQNGTSVQAFSRATNNDQGDIARVDTPTFMAINGDGYFIVGERTAIQDNRPIFNPADFYTRRGDFELDAFGYLRNDSGYYLKGLEVDPTTGNPTGGAPDFIQVSTDFLAASPTTEIAYRANLPIFPITSDTDATVANSELIPTDATNWNNNPFGSGSGPADNVIQSQDQTLFLQNSLAGGALTAYSSNGNATNVQLRWAKTSNTAGAETWNLFYLSNSNPATTTTTQWTRIPQNYVFDANGSLTSPDPARVTINNLTVDGVNLGNITLDHGAGGLTQFDDADGAVQVNALQQDGFPAGELIDVAISGEGRVVAAYDNGQLIDVAEVTLAGFSSPNNLAKLDGGAFQATAESGAAIIGTSGTILGSSLEQSNTEIAEEFTKLIVTQQAYSANSRIITTADELMDETINLIR